MTTKTYTKEQLLAMATSKDLTERKAITELLKAHGVPIADWSKAAAEERVTLILAAQGPKGGKAAPSKTAAKATATGKTPAKKAPEPEPEEEEEEEEAAEETGGASIDVEALKSEIVEEIKAALSEELLEVKSDLAALLILVKELCAANGMDADYIEKALNPED
jgi:ABC-type uncharacterized transport system involved in gliding motility auxiliary subunit